MSYLSYADSLDIVGAVYGGMIFLGAILSIWRGFKIIIIIIKKAVGLLRVQPETHIGHTGNSVRLILALSSKFKPIMQLGVAKPVSSSIWPAFCLLKPWQEEAVGSSFLCLAKLCVEA